jgi:hypothetical protein
MPGAIAGKVDFVLVLLWRGDELNNVGVFVFLQAHAREGLEWTM